MNRRILTGKSSRGNRGFLRSNQKAAGTNDRFRMEGAMESGLTRVHRFDARTEVAACYRSGVSLHSHTMHSKEYLSRLPTYIAKVPLGHFILEREVGRLHLYEKRIFDFDTFYWTPPLSPREAYELECRQIRERLNLAALVSLSDHDNIEAGLHLKLLDGMQQTPISVEWTVPFEETEFHIGVHNLPVARATEWMKQFREFTAAPAEDKRNELFRALTGEPNTLIVLNHPFWDAQAVGADRQRQVLRLFLEKYRHALHAVELNGMRSRRENREVLSLGEDIGLPVVCGGDRHGCQPNSMLNLTTALTFDELVAELREGWRSEILLMPHFFEPLQLRLFENAWHALADAPGEFGRRHWMSRVFIEENGIATPLSQFTGTRFHRVIDKFRWMMALVASPALRPALRLPFLGNQEGGL
jgi:hypothetical protein